MSRRKKIEDENTIEPQKYKFIFEADGKPTTEIDVNKLTKRLIYGDAEFGKPERPNQRTFPGVTAAYNGRNTEGAVAKLQNGWLKQKVEQWKISNNSRDKKLLEEYYHPGTYGGFGYELSNILGRNWKHKDGEIIWNEEDEGSIVSSYIIRELFYEVLNEKFGVNPIPSVDMVTIDDKKIIKRRKLK